MRKRPSGLPADALSRAGAEPPGISVWLVQALVLAPDGEAARGAACACGGVSIDAVVAGGSGGRGLDGAGEAPQNQPAKGFDQPPLDDGDGADSGEAPPADAVRVPRATLGTAGATDPSPSPN